VHFKSSIYDPDVDGEWYENSSKIIPHPGSLIISLIGPKRYQVEVVDAVDPETHKSYYADIGWITTTESQDDLVRILSYANDRWYLFYDDRVKPTKLLVDAKLPILGLENIEYRLVRPNEDGKMEVISIYLDSDEVFRGDRIPMAVADPSKPGIKTCTNCHTLSRMYDGDIVTLQTFNTLGIQTTEIHLIVKRATLLNDLDAQTNPIVHFDALAHQMNGADFYLEQRQDPSHLGITPYVDFADGTREIVPVDNQHCFVYGLDDYTPSFPGQKQRVLIKYFLNHRQKSPIVQDDGRSRYLTVEKWIVVVPNASTYGVKISTIPWWDVANATWRLKFFLYTERRNQVIDVTDKVVTTNFNGNRFYDFQHVMLDIDLSKVFVNEMAIAYRQNLWIKLFPYTDFMSYVLKDSQDTDVAYGVESASWHRPVIHYDQTLEQYFIPTSVFPTVEDFLEAYYYNANPLATDTDTYEPTRPTHFTLRSVDTMQVLITTPIEVDQYEQAWNIVLSDPADLVGSQVMLEFLEYVNGEFTLIWGSPIANIVVSKTGYNV
jgi:hypothetical protein